MSDSHKGACFCGAVQIEVTGEPNVMGFCHCTDCAGWAGAPVNAFSLWSPDRVKVTAGEDKLGNYAKTPGSQRKFCKVCGGHVFTDHPAMGMIDVYLNIVPTKPCTADTGFYGTQRFAVGMSGFKTGCD